jgi:NLR family CARD domain-containing protein 3
MVRNRTDTSFDIRSDFVLPEFPPHQNTSLVEKIAQGYLRSPVCLDGMPLIDQDMKIVVKEAIIGKQCQLLSVQSSKITTAGVLLLVEALNNNQTLETLYLSNNHIGDHGVRLLAETLSNRQNTLKTLVLQQNEITNQGAQYLARMLQANTILLWLYVGENQISDDGVRMLAEAITNGNETLEMLVLSSNKYLTDRCVDYLLPMIKRSNSLKKLWIENCNLSQQGKKALTKAQQEKKDFYVRV